MPACVVDVRGSQTTDRIDRHRHLFAQLLEAGPAHRLDAGMAGGGLHRAKHGEIAAQTLCGLQLRKVVARRGDRHASRQWPSLQLQQLFAAKVHADAQFAASSISRLSNTSAWRPMRATASRANAMRDALRGVRSCTRLMPPSTAACKPSSHVVVSAPGSGVTR